MEIESSASSKYDSGKQLIETFGRGGNLLRYLEPNLSERNNFERQKMGKEKPTKNIGFHMYRKNQQNLKGQLLNSDYQTNEEKNSQDKSHCKQAPFEQIDEISQKINGIIKSISLSCQKRGINSSSKKTLQKSQTVDRLHKLQHKYCNHVSEKHFKNFDNKANQLDKPDEFKSSNIMKKKQTEQKSKFKKSIKKYHQHQQDEHEEEYYDDINQRIQYINDKITRYQQKMASYQQIYRTNKKINQFYFKDGLKQFKENNKIKGVALKTSIVEPKKGEKIDSYNQSASQKTTAKETEKENKHIEKEYKITSSRKESFFNEKYKELLQYKQNKKNKDLCESINKDNKELKKDITLKQSKKTQQKCSRIIEKHSFNPLKKKFEDNLKNKSSFLQALMKQIALDQDFRHAKHMFGGVQLFDQHCSSQSKKWNKLKEQLENQGVKLSLTEVKQIFMPRDDEIDPFMSVSQSHEELIYGVIFAYQACQNNWKENIYRGWSFRELKESGFTSESLDRGKKGYISIQDITFYINTEVDGFYRNRDILLIFNRLGSKQNLKYKEIVDQFLSS